MGTVFKRGKYWHLQFYYRGKQIRKSYGDTDKVAATRRLKIIEADICKGKDIGLYSNNLTFGFLADNLLGYYHDRGLKSIERLRVSIGRLTEHFGGLRAGDDLRLLQPTRLAPRRIDSNWRGGHCSLLTPPVLLSPGRCDMRGAASARGR